VIVNKVKPIIHKFLNNFGYEIQKFYPPTTTKYEPFHPYRYCPWNEDPDFLDTFEKIKTHTLVDKARCYELWSLVKQSKKSEGSIIEIGTWKGGTGAILAKSALLNQITEPVILCDTFTGVVKASTKDTAYKGGEHSDACYQIVEKLFSEIGISNFKILEGIFPEETGNQVSDRKFRLCHIDVDVYKSAKDIVEWIWGKMSLGGIIVFDDYGFRGTDGITKFVNEEMEKSDRIIIYNLNGHAIFIKTN
jgi:O-methyltransferase